MAGGIFREKSIERVSSPEQLNDYIKVTRPGIWLTLTAVILLLIGLIVWGSVGKIETKVDCVVLMATGIDEEIEAAKEEGISELAFCFVKEADISEVSTDDCVRIDGKDYPVMDIAPEPMTVDPEIFSEYAMHVFNLLEGEWVYPIFISASLPEGTYKGEVITDSVSPITFLFN